jgi:hypothetical protein
MWWLEGPDGRHVDLAVEGVSRNHLIAAWMRSPANTEKLNRSVLEKQVRGSAAGLALDERVIRRFGQPVVNAARRDVKRPQHDGALLEGLAGLVQELAGPLGQYCTATGRTIYEAHLRLSDLTAAGRRLFENHMRDALASAVREVLLARGPALDVGALVEGVVDDDVVTAVLQRLARRVLNYAVDDTDDDGDREILAAVALEMDPAVVPDVDPRTVVPEAEQERLRALLSEARDAVGRGRLWSWIARADAEDILQEAAIRTQIGALKIAASGTRVTTLRGLLSRNIGFAQLDHYGRMLARMKREMPADLTAPGAPDPGGRGAPGSPVGDEATKHLRSAELRAVLAVVARGLEDVGSWEAQCAAVILRNPDTDEIQAAVTGIGDWLSDRIDGWPPPTRLPVTTEGPRQAAAEVVRLLRDALLDDPDLWALLGVAPGEPL